MQVINRKTKRVCYPVSCDCENKNFGRKPKIKQTYVALILDKSGSMSYIAEEAVSGFNEQVDVIKQNAKKGGETFVTLVTFNDHIFEHYLNLPVEELNYITKKEYTPHGATAMFDAVGLTLDKLSEFDREGDIGFLVIVISDGMENASWKYRANQIREKVKSLENTGRWTFAYIGANQDLSKVEEMTGFQTSGYISTGVGTKHMSAGMSAANIAYFDSRSIGATRMANYSSVLSNNTKKETENG